MNHKLSIIMPCYNCKQTLEEALTSVYTQNLVIPFEVIMVDDGSTDGTKKLMEELEKKHPEIKIYYHEKNKGGGATRNTAIEKSSGNIIFCLDSDDILPPKMLPKMVDYLLENKYDGVVFEESVFFTKTSELINHKKNTNSNKKYQPISFSDLFAKKKNSLTQVNFLYTKESFYRAGGYPTNHGFDTQGYGFRFLGAGNTTHIYPNSFYYHRQNLNKKSYFHRVYESGLFSINFYLILEEVIYLFSNNIIKQIINYDIYKNNKLGENNIKSFLIKQYEEIDQKIFIADYKNFLKKDGFDEFINKIKDEKTNTGLFVKAIHHYKNKNYQEALNIFLKLSKNGFNTEIIKFNILRCKIGLEGVYNHSEIENKTLESINTSRRKMNLNPNFLIKIALYFKKKIKLISFHKYK